MRSKVKEAARELGLDVELKTLDNSTATVAQAAAALGVQEGQLEAVSYGKERPADTGHDESAWAKNRRAELRER